MTIVDEAVAMHEKMILSYKYVIVQYQQEIEIIQAKKKKIEDMLEVTEQLLDMSRSTFEVEDAEKPVYRVPEYPTDWDDEPWGEHHHNAYGRKLNSAKAKEIRLLFDTGRWTLNALSWKYQVSGGNIHHVLTGLIWTDAGGPTWHKPLTGRSVAAL